MQTIKKHLAMGFSLGKSKSNKIDLFPSDGKNLENLIIMRVHGREGKL